MSHMITAKIVSMKNLKTLERALRMMGVTDFVKNGQIKLWGSSGPTVDLGVRVGQIGNRYDFGFNQLPNGDLSLVREAMESREVTKKLQQDLLQNYVACETESTLQQMGFSLESQQNTSRELTLTFSRWR